MTEDQRGVARPQGANCDPGAYELDLSAPPPPPLPPAPSTGSEEPGMPESEPEPEGEPFYCNLLEGLDTSPVILAIPPETMVMPLYLYMPGGVPGLGQVVEGGPETWDYGAFVGDFESYRCSLQGFEDRLYCMFNLTPEATGQVLDFELYLNDCQDPVYVQPDLTIPLPACSADLSPEHCALAGGAYLDLDDPYCLCP